MMRAFLRGFGYAFQGLRFCVCRERNFRVHVAAAIYVLLIAPYFLLSRTEWALLLLTIGLVIAAEALNTAIEKAVDLSEKRCETARVAKDVAAGAVLLCAITAVGVGIILFFRSEGLAALVQDFSQHIYKPVLLIGSLPITAWLVFRRYR